MAEWSVSHLCAVGSAVRDLTGLSGVDFEVAIDNLYRLRLCSPPAGRLALLEHPEREYQLRSKEIICLTEYGFAFVTACRGPGNISSEKRSGPERGEGR